MVGEYWVIFFLNLLKFYWTVSVSKEYSFEVGILSSKLQ